MPSTVVEEQVTSFRIWLDRLGVVTGFPGEKAVRRARMTVSSIGHLATEIALTIERCRKIRQNNEGQNNVEHSIILPPSFCSSAFTVIPEPIPKSA